MHFVMAGSAKHAKHNTTDTVLFVCNKSAHPFVFRFAQPVQGVATAQAAKTPSNMATPPYLSRKAEFLASSCDAVLVVDGKEFPVHCDVLACHSKILANFVQAKLSYASDCSKLSKAADGLPRWELDMQVTHLTAANFGVFLNHLYNPTKAKVDLVSQQKTLYH